MRTPCLALLLFLGLAMPASAQMLSGGPLRPGAPQAAVGAKVERHRDWLLVCADGAPNAACELQPAVAETEGPRAPAVVIVRPEAGVVPVLVVRTPLEMLLAEGIALSVDGSTLGRLAYQTCDAGGCVAPIRLEGPLAATMRGGLTMVLRSVSRDGEATITRLSLLGLTAGLAALAR